MVKNTKVLNVVNMACHLVYRQASKIVVLSPGFKKRLIDRGVSESKIEVIYNWCNESALENHEECSVKLPSNGKLNLVFAGNLGFAQGLPAIIDAAEILKEGKVDVNIVFVGDGVAKADAINISQVKTLDNVYFLPRVPMTQIGSILLEADMLLVHLNDDELFRITIPSRTQANLATGKPIVMGVKGDAADLIDMAGAGLICEPNNPVLLADAIKKLVEKTPQEREMMGHNAKHFYNENLSLRKGVSRFISIFEDIQ